VEEDRALLERLRAGDGRAFEALVARHDGALRRVARTLVRTDSAADEVVQETWLGVLRGLGRFEERSSLRTWIFRIIVNTARTRATRDARSVPFSALEGDDRPAVEATAFGADGRWTSAPTRLEGTPRADCSAASCVSICCAPSTGSRRTSAL
jgi:RNA polymerase sigma-70 factor, ECF subfamily